MTEISDHAHPDHSHRRTGPRKSLSDWYKSSASVSDDEHSQPSTPKSPAKRCKLVPKTDFFIGHESESEDDRVPAEMRQLIRSLCAEYFETHVSDLRASLSAQCAALFRDDLRRSVRSQCEDYFNLHVHSFCETQSKLSEEVQSLQKAIDQLKEVDQTRLSVDTRADAGKVTAQNPGHEEFVGLGLLENNVRNASTDNHQAAPAGNCPDYSQELHEQMRELRQEMRMIGKQITWRMLGSAEAERSDAGSVTGSVCGSVAGSIASAAAASFSRGTRDVRERLLARRQRKCEQSDAVRRASQHGDLTTASALR